MTVTLTGKGVLAGMRRLATIALLVFPFGFGYGAAAINAGMTPLEATAMSALVFAGASQFAVLDLWVQPLPLLSLALITLVVNARHIIFGAALAPDINSLPRRKRILAGLFLSDANFADMQIARRNGDRDLGILVGGGLIMWIIWVLGTAAGAFAGGATEDLSKFGLDMVMAAFFMTVMVGGLRTGTPALPLIVGAIVAILTLSFLPVGWNVLAGAFAGGIAGVLRRA